MSVSGPVPARPQDRVIITRYAAVLSPADVPLRTFRLPELLYAVEKPGDTGDDCSVIRFQSKAADSPATAATVSLDGITVSWQNHSFAVIGPAEKSAAFLNAVLEFDHLARCLDEIENALPAYESAAAGDVAFSYRIRGRHRREWDRITTILESLAKMRLRLPRMESLIAKPADDLSPNGRRLFRALARRIGANRRLTSASDRLESLEDLYEGAVDRINDHRYWRDGHVLEIIIIIMLAVEGLLIGIELYYHLTESR